MTNDEREKEFIFGSSIANRMMIAENLIKTEMYSNNPIKKFFQKIGLLKKDKISAKEYINLFRSGEVE